VTDRVRFREVGSPAFPADCDKEKLQERVAKLAGGAAVIKVLEGKGNFGYGAQTGEYGELGGMGGMGGMDMKSTP